MSPTQTDHWAAPPRDYAVDPEALAHAEGAPVFDPGIGDPVEIESIELLRADDLFLVRSRATNGAEGYGVTNVRARYLYPILLERVIPYFVGKDARDLEVLIDGVYVHQSNYKLTGLALWNCVAWVEFSLLDLLGRISGRSIGQMFGGIVRQRVPMYFASGRRDTTAEQEVEHLQQCVVREEVRAVKFRLGGRMSEDTDALPGRTERLIALARQVLGERIALLGDANGSYSVPRAIEIGWLMEQVGGHHYEEPCPLDHLEELREVTQALDIPVAFGEQETSQRRFRWILENRAARIIQPDLHYNGGFIRSTRVARMAATAGVPVTPHISGGPLTFVEVLHFASYVPNVGEYHEFKGGLDRANRLLAEPLVMEDGCLHVPGGPGLGLAGMEEICRRAIPVAGGLDR